MAKYPGGTPGRWEKVALEMGKSVKDVSIFVLKYPISKYPSSILEQVALQSANIASLRRAMG